jgi:phage FluMu protein Com
MTQEQPLKKKTETGTEYIRVERDKEIRCPHCGRLLGKGTLGEDGKLEMKCPRNRCKQLVRFRAM